MESQIESVKALDAYRLRQVKHIPELNSDGMILEHKKTGANIFLMSNEDNNKVFCIGFRTPPSDSTGVPHIIEHTVLCGSDKFPVKDPFVELVKGSLNTFLNAMTYPDKTVYPIASCNDTDFQNLMDVYMDAVFHPNIGKEKKIFMQEGWHYELEEPEGEITYNGVVYNEMKGVFSAPESVLDSYIHTAMFPDTCYGVESGGDPEDIVKLTYEDYLAFYHKYYHPSNSYIYLYGDMDMTEKLRWLDEEYLGKYDRKEIDSEIQIQKKFKEPIEREIFYSVSESESLDHATYLSINTQAGNELSPKEYVAFQILEYVLLDAPGAPLKKALLDAGIGDDIMGGYEYGILQPYFSVIAKNAEREQKDEFVKVVKSTLKRLADGGIDEKSLKAGINNYEFQYREADYGSAPKGLMYGLQCLDSWLYGGDPMMHLEYEDTFAALKEGADNGYFEGLIKTYLLDNPYEAVVIASPKKNLTARIEEQTAKKLKEYKNSLSEAEIEALILDHPEQITLQSGTAVGAISEYANAKEDYISYLASCIAADCTGMRVVLDCANGSSSATAESLFTRLGAEVHMLSASPDGTNINKNCGSTHMENLMEYVKTHECDLGLAFDGDADRCLAVDENGKLVDGDKIIAICAHALQQEGKLKKNTAVVTVMTNLGFFHFAKANQIATKATKVGDRYVLEEMLSGGYNIGGEQSGHIIFLDEATTGDGELSGIKLLEILKKSGKKMSELAGLMECFPQVLYNVTIQPQKKGLWQDDADIAAVIEKHTAILGDNGRILVRESGTEPLIRVMVEGKNAGQIEAAAQEITEQVKIFAAS